MAEKARMLSQVIREVLKDESTNLYSQMMAFKKHLIHDLKEEKFSDIYAQTIAYGMFAAWLHDDNSTIFSRRKAAELMPVTNPFLRKFFQHIAGFDLDRNISWIVDDLADIFRYAKADEIMKKYNDPFLHFYETFLSEYDAKERKKRGVYYTPQPVVDFIVKSVDKILKDEFGFVGGLSDTAKTSIRIDNKNKKKSSACEEEEMHKIQILDPAAGTGAFLATIIQHIKKNIFHNQLGIWKDYVHNDLISRINGFEVLMASYAMAHIKLEMILRDTECDLEGKRLRVFLTNSLEKHHPDTSTLFAKWLSDEAREANFIKRDAPIMVIIGNPPYYSKSSNKSEWIKGLVDEYKFVDGEPFNEKKHWLYDDYVKFIRYGQHFIDRTGEGILAYINNHSFLDNRSFPGMRWHLLNSFEKIYVLNLHGDANKREVAPDGSVDQNVFKIRQGVSINFFGKNEKKTRR